MTDKEYEEYLKCREGVDEALERFKDAESFEDAAELLKVAKGLVANLEKICGMED